MGDSDLIVYRLEQLENKVDELIHTVMTLNTSVAVLKVKMAFIGGIAGIVTSGITSLLVKVWLK